MCGAMPAAVRVAPIVMPSLFTIGGIDNNELLNLQNPAKAEDIHQNHLPTNSVSESTKFLYIMLLGKLFNFFISGLTQTPKSFQLLSNFIFF
jgi:hypothetical protein